MGASSRLAFPAIPVTGGIIAIALASGGYLWWHGHVPASRGTPSSVAAPITERDSIILSDFANHTGDPVFDTTLNQALAIQLEQSPLLTIVSEVTCARACKYLGKSSDERSLPRSPGRSAFARASRPSSMAPSPSSATTTIVTLEAQSTSTGDVIAANRAQAADKDHVLTALDQATATMRAQLGESLSSIQK